MTGTEVIQTIPFTAWQQAAIIGLFIVFAALVFAYLTRHEEKREANAQAFQKSESDKWQTYIADENEKWRAFSQKQRDDNNCAMAKVDESLTNLTNITGKLVMTVDEMRSDLKDHDRQAKEILALVQKPTRAPRPK